PAEIWMQRTFGKIDRRIPVTRSAGVSQAPRHPHRTLGIGNWQRSHEYIVEIVGIKPPAEHHLAEIVHAADALRLGFGFGQRGQKQTRENSDDGYDHQQFDEREAATAQYHWRLGVGCS